MQSVSKKDTVSFQTGDSSILGKGENACLERQKMRIQCQSNQETKTPSCLNIEVSKLDRASHTTQKMAQVSKKVDRGIETFTQPGGKTFGRAEEARMKLTSHGYRQIPLGNGG